MHRPSLHPEGVKMPREVDRRCPEMQSKERTPLTSTRLFSWICSEKFLLCKSQHTHSTAKMQAWPGKWTGQVWTLPKGNTQWYQMPQLLLSKQEPESSPHLRLSHQTLNTAYEVKPWGSFTFVTRQTCAEHQGRSLRGLRSEREDGEPGVCRAQTDPGVAGPFWRLRDCAGFVLHPSLEGLCASSCCRPALPDPRRSAQHRCDKHPISTPTPGLGRLKSQMIKPTPNWKYKTFSRSGITF